MHQSAPQSQIFRSEKKKKKSQKGQNRLWGCLLRQKKKSEIVVKKNEPSCISSRPHIPDGSTERMSVPCFSIGAISFPCSTDIHIHIHIHIHFHFHVCMRVSCTVIRYCITRSADNTHNPTIPQSHNRTASATSSPPARQPSKRI